MTTPSTRRWRRPCGRADSGPPAVAVWALRAQAREAVRRGLAFYVLWSAFVITTPFLGAWLSSSLAVFQNGAVWVSALIGLALFPLLPLGWDQLATFLRNRG